MKKFRNRSSALPEITLTLEPSSRFPVLSAVLEKLFRLLIVYVAACGINRMLQNALQLEVSASLLFLLPLLLVTIFALLLYSKKTAPFGAVVILLLSLFTKWLTGEGPFLRLLAGGAALWNRFMEIIDRLGFMTLPPIGENLPTSEENLIFLSSVITVTAFFLSLRFRITLLGPVMWSLFVASPIFVYNMLTASDGVALTVSALIAAFAMRLAAKRTEAHAPGFVGVTALLLALLLFVGPVTQIREPFQDIPVIAERVEMIRRMLTNLAQGQSPFVTVSTGNVYEPRSTTATRRRYTGEKVMEVYADHASPLYLRTWVGDDYEDSFWRAPSVNETDSSYNVSHRLLDYFFSLLQTVYGDEAMTLLGFSSDTITVKPSLGGQLLPLPVTTSAFALGDRSQTVSHVSDGLYTFQSMTKTPYVAQAILPIDRGGVAAYRFNEAVSGCFDFLQYCREGVMPEGMNEIGQTLCREADTATYKEFAEFAAVYAQYYAGLYNNERVSSAAVDAVITDLFETTALSQYFHRKLADGEAVKGNDYYQRNGVFCLPDPDSDGYLVYYLGSRAAAADVDAVIRIVRDYLAEHYSYSLDPQASDKADAMDAFLTDSREGYCVQFATAGALILRRLGFTVRYAEGFLADDFRRNKAEDNDSAYVCRVLDSDAHAWTEVWVENFGWLIAEMTPDAASTLYGAGPVPPITETTGPDTGSPETAEPVTTGADVTTAPTTDDPPRTLQEETDPAETTGGISSGPATDGMPWLPTVVVMLLVVLGGGWVIRREKRHRRARRRLLTEALSPSSLTAAQRSRLEKELTEVLTEVLHLYGLSPRDGELPSDFALRADRDLETLVSVPKPSAAIGCLMAGIYGGSMSNSELETAARFLVVLTEAAKRHLGPLRYLWYRYGRCIL